MTSDNTPEIDPTETNVEDFFQGLQPTTRSVRVYFRTDLAADIDEANRDLDAARREADINADESLGEADRVTDAEAHLVDLYHRMMASGMTIRVRGRSSDWRNRRIDELEKAGVDDPAERALTMIAESIVSPTGITLERLKALGDASQQELKKVFGAWHDASEADPVPTAPFSPSPSKVTRG